MNNRGKKIPLESDLQSWRTEELEESSVEILWKSLLVADVVSCEELGCQRCLWLSFRGKLPRPWHLYLFLHVPYDALEDGQSIVP